METWKFAISQISMEKFVICDVFSCPGSPWSSVTEGRMILQKLMKFRKSCQIFGKISDLWKNFRFLENFQIFGKFRFLKNSDFHKNFRSSENSDFLINVQNFEDF